MFFLKCKITFISLFASLLLYGQESDLKTQIEKSIQNRSHIEALKLLDSYGYFYGQDGTFDAFLMQIADAMDQNDFCCLIESEQGERWAKLLLTLAQKRTKESIALQQKSELIARMLMQKESCNPCTYDLFAETAKVFSAIPSVDFIAVRRAYGNILSLDPCDILSLARMANAARLAGWFDYSGLLYRDYFRYTWGTSDQILEYSQVLEAQYNITFALRLNEIYGRCIGYEMSYWNRKAHILNYGSLSEDAYMILCQLLQENPNDFVNWAIYSQAAATINRRQEALYGLCQAQCLKPGDIETHWAEWLTIPPILSRWTVAGSCYQESTTLLNFTETGNYYQTYDPNTKYIVGVETFQTRARPKNITVGGLGRLVGPDNQEAAEVESGWVGIDQVLYPKFIYNLRMGIGRSNIAGANDQWTPAYYLDLDSRQSDYLTLHLFSSYNFYQISPRASYFKIRRWRNLFTIDWRPNYDVQFLTTIDGRAHSDGNKQIEIFFYPRRNFLYLEHWKLTAGLLGNWITTRKDPIHGYYAPHLYQVYAAQFLAENRLNMHSTIKATIAGGTQKDNFSTFFGPFMQTTLDCYLEFSLYWRFRFTGDFYFIKQSGGSFNYLLIFGELTHRF